MCLIIGVVLLLGGCSMAVDEKSEEGMSLEQKFILHDLYLDEAFHYIDYLGKFHRYVSVMDIDSATIYNDSCQMSAYTLHVISNKIEEGK